MIGLEEFNKWYQSNNLWMLVGLLIAELNFLVS